MKVGLRLFDGVGERVCNIISLEFLLLVITTYNPPFQSLSFSQYIPKFKQHYPYFIWVFSILLKKRKENCKMLNHCIYNLGRKKKNIWRHHCMD